MRTETVREAVNRHFKLIDIVRAVIIMFGVCLIAYMLGSAVSHAYQAILHTHQSMSSADSWFVYFGVSPKYTQGTGFFVGENLTMESDVDRKHGMDARREDTPRCKVNGFVIKQDPQFRPKPYPATEWVEKGAGKKIRPYKLTIDAKATECKICGTIRARTPLGYEKKQSYCTDFFPVNR